MVWENIMLQKKRCKKNCEFEYEQGDFFLKQSMHANLTEEKINSYLRLQKTCKFSICLHV